MDELTGTRVDHIGGLNLTQVNSVPGVTGKVRNAAQFAIASANTYLRGINSSLYDLGASAFTIAFWIKVTSIPAVFMTVISQGDSLNAGQYNWRILVAPNTGQIQLAFQGGHSILNSTVNLVAGNWTFVVLWQNSTSLNMQQNNGTIDTNAATFFSLGGAGGTFDFGAIGAGLSELNGLIDSTQVWNRVLTAGERTTLWNNGAGV